MLIKEREMPRAPAELPHRTRHKTVPGGPALSVRGAVERFIRERRTRNLSEHTIRMYCDRLQSMCHYLEDTRQLSLVDQVSTDDLRGHVEQQKQRGLSEKTINTGIQCIKTFFGFLVEEEVIDNDPSTRLRKMVGPRPVIKPLKPQQVQAIIDIYDRKTVAGARGRVLTILLYSNGLRISEAVGILLDDIDWDDHAITIRGKGRKERLAHLHPETARELRKYVDRWLSKTDSRCLFPNRYGLPLSRRSAARSMRAAGIAAGAGPVHPHQLRHSFAIEYLRQGGDPLTLQRELGHSSLDMVNRYVSMEQTDIKRKHCRFSPVAGLKLRSSGRNADGNAER